MDGVCVIQQGGWCGNEDIIHIDNYASVMNSLFTNSDSLGSLDEVYSDGGERGTKARDDQGG